MDIQDGILSWKDRKRKEEGRALQWNGGNGICALVMANIHLASHILVSTMHLLACFLQLGVETGACTRSMYQPMNQLDLEYLSLVIMEQRSNSEVPVSIRTYQNRHLVVSTGCAINNYKHGLLSNVNTIPYLNQYRKAQLTQ